MPTVSSVSDSSLRLPSYGGLDAARQGGCWEWLRERECCSGWYNLSRGLGEVYQTGCRNQSLEGGLEHLAD